MMKETVTAPMTPARDISYGYTGAPCLIAFGGLPDFVSSLGCSGSPCASARIGPINHNIAVSTAGSCLLKPCMF